MKKLYLMRHATSDWPKHIATDVERPLNKQGEKEAQIMANQLKKNHADIDLMLVSIATRTQETSKFINNTIKVKNTVISEDIYETTHEKLLEAIQKTPSDVQSLLLLAHNPSISMLGTVLLGTYADFPPAVLMEIHLDIEQWAEIQRDAVSFSKIEMPTMFT